MQSDSKSPSELNARNPAGSAPLPDLQGNAQAENPMLINAELSTARPVSVFDIYCSFTILALQGFGGVVAIVQRELVEKKRWMTQQEFLEEWAVAQIMPGPNVVNLSLMLGHRFLV